MRLNSDIQRNQAYRAFLDDKVAEFVASGGQIEEVPPGCCQRNPKPRNYVVESARTPVYAALFEGSAVPAFDPKAAKLASLVATEAAKGRSPSSIGWKLGLLERQVRQIGRDYHIRFHVQR